MDLVSTLKTSIDKEIEEDEAAQATASTDVEPSQANQDDDAAPPA